MIDINECTGCGACSAICNHRAISMIPDCKGFLRPYVDKEKCVNCRLCDKVCEVANSKSDTNYKNIIALKHNDIGIKQTSTSGGAFRLFADFIVRNGGVVYGAAYDEDFSVHHKRCETIEDLCLLQKSKYVQSDTHKVYELITNDIESGRKVLYSGTACQCSGIIAFANRKRLNTELLITCDVICHGVPSPQIWIDYLKFRKLYGGDIMSADFRYKKKSWRDFRMAITFKDGKTKTYRQNEDYFMILFFHDYILRESCYNCKFTTISRKTDFTLGDFWGLEEFYPEFDDDKGTSVVLLNSSKAIELFESVKNDCSFISIKESELVFRQPNLKRPSPKNSQFDTFWNDYSKNGFEYCIKKYADNTFFGQLKRKYLFKILYYTGIFKFLLKFKAR